MPTDPSLPSLAAFLLVVGFVLVAFVGAWVRWAKGSLGWALAGAVGWAGLTALPTAVGLFTVDNAVPRLPLFLAALLVSSTAFAVAGPGRRLASTPLVALVAFQGFRLPLELVLHDWVAQGVVPPQMTWSSANIDIVSGIVALLAAPFVARSKALAWATQAVGIVLLLNVIRVVVQSFDTPLKQFDAPVLLALSVPEVWIATVCVCGAWVAHLVTVRALLSA